MLAIRRLTVPLVFGLILVSLGMVGVGSLLGYCGIAVRRDGLAHAVGFQGLSEILALLWFVPIFVGVAAMGLVVVPYERQVGSPRASVVDALLWTVAAAGAGFVVVGQFLLWCLVQADRAIDVNEVEDGLGLFLAELSGVAALALLVPSLWILHERQSERLGLPFAVREACLGLMVGGTLEVLAGASYVFYAFARWGIGSGVTNPDAEPWTYMGAVSVGVGALVAGLGRRGFLRSRP